MVERLSDLRLVLSAAGLDDDTTIRRLRAEIRSQGSVSATLPPPHVETAERDGDPLLWWVGPSDLVH